MRIDWTNIDYDNGMRLSFTTTVNGVEYRNMLDVGHNEPAAMLAERFRTLSDWFAHIDSRKESLQKGVPL